MLMDAFLHYLFFGSLKGKWNAKPSNTKMQVKKINLWDLSCPITQETVGLVIAKCLLEVPQLTHNMKNKRSHGGHICQLIWHRRKQ